MSGFSGSLPEGQRPGYLAACQEAGRRLRAARAARPREPAAVAEAAWYPGHPLGSREAVAAEYGRLLARAAGETEAA